MLGILLSVLVCAAASLFCACLVSVHMLMVVYIPNLVHNSLDVRYTVFVYNYKFRERDDVGHVVTLSLGQVVTYCYCGADSLHLWDESCKLLYRHHRWHVTFL